jgi:hypothetical protein
VLLLLGLVAWMQLRPKHHDDELTANNKVNAEINKAEQYYASMIEAKRTELNKYCSAQPKLCYEFDKELDTLNSMYGQLKHEYNRTADKEAVLQAMINNLQIQLQVLSQQLQVIKHVEAKQQTVI